MKPESRGDSPPDSRVFTNTPVTVFVICGTVIGAVLVVCVTLLLALGRDPTDLRTIISTVFNGATVLLSSGAFIYAGSAAKGSHDANHAIRNGVLKSKIKEVLIEHDKEVHGIGG